MPYTPTADAAAMTTALADNLAGAASPGPWTALGAGGVSQLPSKAMMDALLSSIGYRAQSDGAGIGTAATSSTSFADIGDGAATGFATWAVTVPVAKTYLLHVDLSFYVTGAAGNVTFQIMVDAATTGVSNPAAASVMGVNALSTHMAKSWRVPIAFAAAGSKVVKLQWKVSNVLMVATVDTTDYRLFTLQG